MYTFYFEHYYSLENARIRGSFMEKERTERTLHVYRNKIFKKLETGWVCGPFWIWSFVNAEKTTKYIKIATENLENFEKIGL